MGSEGRGPHQTPTCNSGRGLSPRTPTRGPAEPTSQHKSGAATSWGDPRTPFLRGLQRPPTGQPGP